VPLERERERDLAKMQQKTHVQKDENQRDKYKRVKEKLFDITTRSQVILNYQKRATN